MKNYQFDLEPYKGKTTRYTCPSCGDRGTFTRYFNTETKEILHPEVGRCDHAISCGYNYTPKQYFQDNPEQSQNFVPTSQYSRPDPVPKPISFIPEEAFQASFQDQGKNHFLDFMKSEYIEEEVDKVKKRYLIGTSDRWYGATAFWQKDLNGRFRTGKIMLYDALTGKRVKKPVRISMMHTVLNISDFNLKQCLFGEHLLQERPEAPVALVESEKTAIIASIHLPEFIWLAVGGLSNLSPEKCRVLAGRDVALFPDLNGYDKWNAKGKEIFGNRYQIYDFLEKHATEAERANGLDLADYLLKLDRNKPFRKHPTPEQVK